VTAINEEGRADTSGSLQEATRLQRLLRRSFPNTRKREAAGDRWDGRPDKVAATFRRSGPDQNHIPSLKAKPAGRKTAETKGLRVNETRQAVDGAGFSYRKARDEHMLTAPLAPRSLARRKRISAEFPRNRRFPRS
jgi:hypothetical protein